MHKGDYTFSALAALEQSVGVFRRGRLGEGERVGDERERVGLAELVQQPQLLLQPRDAALLRLHHARA